MELIGLARWAVPGDGPKGRTEYTSMKAAKRRTQAASPSMLPDRHSCPGVMATVAEAASVCRRLRADGRRDL